MKKSGQWVSNLVFFGIAAYFIKNMARSGRLSFFHWAIIIAAVFFALARGLMQLMLFGADDSLPPGGIPAGRKRESPAEEYKEVEEVWEDDEPAQTIRLTLPAGRAAISHVKGTPLSQMGVDLENFCLTFNGISKHMQGDVQADVTFEGDSYRIEVFPLPLKPAPQAAKPNYKDIASQIGTEAELRELERKEREELKRAEKEYK